MSTSFCAAFALSHALVPRGLRLNLVRRQISHTRHATIRVTTRSQGESTPPPEPVPRRENNLLERLNAIPDKEPPTPSKKLLESPGRLREAIQYLKGPLFEDFERFLDNPIRLLSAASLSILFGFFSATSASTIIGSVADWDPLAAAVLLIWTEGFTKIYYRREKKSRLLRLINAFKIGLIYGMTVDAFKLST